MKQLIASLAEKRIPFFQKLIQIPSLRGGERLVQMFVANELKQLGLDVKLLQHQPAETLSDGSLMGPVTVGVLKGTGGGRSLILNFHVDTAPPGPEELWTMHPFSGTVEGGLIHGRGAVDDKAGCIEVLLVLDLLNECGIRLKGDLIIQSVVEDEYSGRGTELCLKKGYRADAALIVDGHFGTRAALGNAGQLEFMLSLQQKASPERPFRGNQSFVEDVSLLLRKLALWSKMLDKNTDPQWVPICSPGLNTGKISYKQASEESAAECSIDGLVKFGGPFTAERLMKLFRRRIERIAASHRIFKRYDMDLRFGDLRHNPIAITADTDFFRALSESVSAVMGEPASTQICRGWCDMEYFWRDYSIPCYLYGPGRGRNAHAPDECFELDQFIPHTEVLVELAKRWCGV